eukprot:280277-Pelagomonas_calceolata.AAC.1
MLEIFVRTRQLALGMDWVVHPQMPFPLIIPSTTEPWCYAWRLPLCTAPFSEPLGGKFSLQVLQHFCKN